MLSHLIRHRSTPLRIMLSMLPALFMIPELSAQAPAQKDTLPEKQVIVLDDKSPEAKPMKLPRFYIGATGGMNMSSVIFNPTVTQSLQPGFDAGAVFRIDVESYAGIWLELVYSRRGWKERNDDHPELTYSRSTSYFMVPFMTHFMVGKGKFKVTIDAGPHFGLFLNETSRSTYPTADTTASEGNEEAKPVVYGRIQQHDIPTQKKFAWGLGGGPGFEYHLKNMVVGLRFSYYYGLGDIFNNTKTEPFNKSSEQVYSAKAYLLYAF